MDQSPGTLQGLGGSPKTSAHKQRQARASSAQNFSTHLSPKHPAVLVAAGRGFPGGKALSSASAKQPESLSQHRATAQSPELSLARKLMLRLLPVELPGTRAGLSTTKAQVHS